MSAINKRVIKYLQGLLANSNSVKTINHELQNVEPELVKWCQERAQDDVTGFLRGGVFANPEIVSELGNRFVAARLAGYLLAQVSHTYEFCNKLSLKLTENGDINDDIEKEYDEWISGKLPERYYSYKVDKKAQDEESKILQQAQDNHTKYRKECEEKQQREIEHEKKVKMIGKMKLEAGITEEKGEGNIIRRTRRKKKESGPDLTIDDPGK